MNVTPFDLQPHAARFLQAGGDLSNKWLCLLGRFLV
jgi:hypothetical protein